MTNFSISGLSSGIDTTSVITQLMGLAAAPQNALKNQLSTVQSQQSAYQAVNAKYAALKTAADKLASVDTWKATTATSTDTSVVASGSSAAVSGSSTTFSVTQLAKAQVSTLAVSDPSNVGDGSGSLNITVGSTTTNVSLAGNSAADVASAINGAGLGIRAALINTSNGGQVLQFSSNSTGSANSFSISGLNGSVTNIANAQDATVTIGDPNAGGYSVTSSTNTFTDAIPGVTFTVSKPVTDVTVSVASNTSSISDAIKALVSAANDSVSISGQATGKGAILAGDQTINRLSQGVLGVISAGASGGQSYSKIGVTVTSTGTLTFDADAFAAAYAKDPSGTQALAQTALGGGFSAQAASGTDSTTGSLTQLITADTNQISSLNKQISTWDTKLADQKAALEARYAAMESSLSKLKSQSSYLTSAFASLTASQSSSSSGN